jgi:Tfp pilus assembly protein PilZ
MLAVVFDTKESLKKQFDENISKGGIFVVTDEPQELRTRVEVGVELKFCREQIVLEGEVVHCVPRELASTGATPGIALQLTIPMDKIRQLFEPHLVGVPETPDPEPETPKRPSPADRRDSKRHTARVHARVQLASGGELEGLTRDISASGMLISISGDPPELGEEAKIHVINPVTGEEIAISGRVVRHLEGKAGAVPAIGIRFDPDPGDAARTAWFLERLEAAESNRRLGGIKGELAELGAVNLLQSFGLSSQVGTLTMMRGAEEGYIAYSEGLLVAARVGAVRGQKAMVRLLNWSDGEFEFHARVDPLLVLDEPRPLEAAILDAMRQLDDGQRSRQADFAPEVHFEVELQGSVAASGLEKLERAILDLIEVGMNVRKLLDVIPEPDTRIQQALRDLTEQGIIRPIG